MIQNNSFLPSKILLIDNSEPEGAVNWYLCCEVPMQILHCKSKRVNESWEIGRNWVSDNCDFVSFLNDDLIIGDWFFQRVIETFAANELYGIVVPNTVDSPDLVKKGKVKHTTPWKGLKLEGWAFTVKKSVLDQVPPIPYGRLTTFYGDNWIWKHVKNIGYVCGKDLGNNIYHYVGKSILKLGYRRLKKPEYNEWHKVKKETWG